MTFVEQFQSHLISSKLPSLVRKPLRFFIVGTIGTFVQTGFFLLLMICLSQPEKNSLLYYVAFIGGFILEMIPNFYCMSFYTFGAMPNWKNATGFVLARAINLIIQLVILPLMILWLPSVSDAIISPIVIFIAGIINFLMQWFFFRKKTPDTKHQTHDL